MERPVGLDIVSIWAGRLPDPEALDEYVAFSYPADGPGTSPFLRDQGIAPFDEDFAEAEWFGDASYSFVHHSYGESFARLAGADLANLAGTANCVYLVYGVAVEEPAAHVSPLALLGRYTYRR